MGRQKLIRYSDGAYHVNAKTNNGDWFPIPLKDCWYIYGYHLQKMSVQYNLKIHAFVLMNNHFHLLCSTPEENLDKAMNYFMQMTSKGINFAAKRKNHLYGGKYFWTHLDDSVGYAAVFKYIFRNPIRANLCKDFRHYPWLSLHDEKINFNITRNELDELVPQANLEDWINLCPEKFDETLLKKTLRRKIFENPKRNSKKVCLREYLK